MSTWKDFSELNAAQRLTELAQQPYNLSQPCFSLWL
jgi:hypothetical protein